MKVFFISPIGYETPGLFQTFTKTFIEQGHSVVTDVKQADVVFVDLYSNIGEFDLEQLRGNEFLKKPFVYFDATDYGGMSTERFNPKQYDKISKYCKVVYFMRKMGKYDIYPPYVYPYELIQYPDHDFPPTTKEELFSRPNDICFIGNTSPQRESVCNELSKHFKCDFVLGEQRLPHEEWLNRHRQSKFFLSADGGGFSDERPYQLISISAMLKQRNNHLQLNPIPCVEVDEMPTPSDISILKTIISSDEALYYIYTKGIEYVKQYYNEYERGMYILMTLKENGIC